MKNEIIQRVLGSLAVPGKTYHVPLPEDIADWYCYTGDGGHSILCILTVHLAEAFAPMAKTTDYLVPVPVKTVLRGYTKANDFVVVDLKYSSRTGLEITEEDEEF